MQPVTWKVGELAEQTGLSVRPLHYYDEVGLLSPSYRTDGGYRLYTAGDVPACSRSSRSGTWLRPAGDPGLSGPGRFLCVSGDPTAPVAHKGADRAAAKALRRSGGGRGTSTLGGGGLRRGVHPNGNEGDIHHPLTLSKSFSTVRRLRSAISSALGFGG